MAEPDIQPAPSIHLRERTAAHTPPDFSTPPRNKWEREYRAFWLMLPELLRTHRGKYVAVHDEHLVDSGDDPISLATRVYATFGYVPIYVGLVAERMRVERVPHFRVLSE